VRPPSGSVPTIRLLASEEDALEADTPFVPIPFGTRNHVARDDRDDPIGALAAFRADERRVAHARGWTEYAARRFHVESRRPRIHAAIDGAPVVLGRRLEFEIRPRALRALAAKGSADVRADDE
jgi:hypothetical protein